MGVNGEGLESGNDTMVMGRTMPLLQDTLGAGAWSKWTPEYRDVVIVDGEGKRRGAYNLTVNDLNVAGNFAALKQALLDAR